MKTKKSKAFGDKFTISIPKPIMKLKGVISLLLLISFILVAITGVVLQQSIAKGVKLSNPIWLKIHNISGYAMIVFVILHLFFNSKLFFMEILYLFGWQPKNKK
ncbi:hypothetical protein SU69_08510 [Thermosipho melanesiensis]|uniref:Flavinylation-associated cytochrome domain-containing protein n=2 Tax=Thermosipho melanesiensis TaxID=46541 RepID=A6LNM0_THEM4|nr:DUF4405 domain-containing protein [Thermosipho melanesiensis]ABR31521.1 hypothetical protein Tmel_1678 [Thermosipho melanesiensis BI429]APT74941.1 hypothetical protein BW47_08885 [Thermosipho melanesiensis]OOC35269.1 hypothetical protein SU69_08510 [Thermosipho melanesiensis]OOC35488.1 hypothetical protein SU70_08520 [Thermosipho melanesiensis]OOC36524.1 hypothetical protein SU68_08575 [Thermosipho melanesiensis]